MDISYLQKYITGRNEFIKNIEETRKDIYRLRQVLLIYVLIYDKQNLNDMISAFKYYDGTYEQPYHELDIEKLREQKLNYEEMYKIAKETMKLQSLYICISVHKERTVALIRYYERENNLDELIRWNDVMHLIHTHCSYITDTNYLEIKEIDDEIKRLRMI